MIDEVKEPLKQVNESLKERLNSPYWGFIFFSWLGFNWQNIAKLLMSKKIVEERIADITSQNFFFIHYWIGPVIVGVILAILAPYFQQWLELSHNRALIKKRDKIKEIEVNKLQDQAYIDSEAIRIQGEVDEKGLLEQQRLDLIESREKARKALVDLRTTKLEKAKENIEKEYKEAERKLSQAFSDGKKIEELLSIKVRQQDMITQRLNDIGKVYFKFDKISTKGDFVNFISALNKTDVLKLDNLNDEFKAMMERELINKNLENK